MLPPPTLVALARAIASQHALDPAQESSWDTHAIRYEPAFRSRYVSPLGLPPTEEIVRSISWGLMQVMGQSAREHGFAGKFLSALCDPPSGITAGCSVFTAKMSRASGDIQRALALWNGGSNPTYATEVLARLANYR